MTKNEERLEKLLNLREYDDEKATKLFYEWIKTGVFEYSDFVEGLKIMKYSMRRPCSSCGR